MMNKKERNHIMNMNRGMKQKISMLLIACLLFTGYQGMTLPGRAAQEDEQNNAISVSGTEVKVQLLGEDLRRAAKEAIEKGERVNDKVFKGYSKDADLEKEYEAVFSPEKEVYEIPLDSISTGLSESLAEEEAGLEVFVERDAQDLDNLVRKESKESLLLYDGNSQISQLFPKNEETAVKKEEAEKKASEELASNSNLPRNTELTGSELITFLYKNKSDHRITFQLSVDSNKYPKVVVSPKGQLFKELLAKLKKEEKNRTLESKKNTENKAVESTEVKNTAAKEPEESKAATETVATEAQKESTSVKESTSAAQESSSAAASEVRLVSEESKQETKVETAAAETEEKAQTAAESKETAASETEKETAGQKETEKRAEEKLGNGFLAEVVAHYDEFLAEFQSARFTQYSLNELGRKSQNAEIENFATVEVFYDKDAFDEDVVLEAKRLVKPEEEGQKEGEKLTEEQVKAMKDQAIYDDSDALDIRFVSKDDRTKEVEPKVPVSVRLTFDKEAVPEKASADTVAIHHIVEEKDTGKVKMVETLVRAELEKKAEEQVEARKSAGDVAEREESTVDVQTTHSESLAKLEKESAASEQKEGITKEFTVSSFSAFIVNWQKPDCSGYKIRLHYVDQNFREIAPTIYTVSNAGRSDLMYFDINNLATSPAYKKFENYDLWKVGVQKGPAPYHASPLINGGWSVDEIRSNRFQQTQWNEKGQIVKTEPVYFWNNDLYHDFYFIYSLSNCPKKSSEASEEASYDKYITDNRDGTYDLTLTGPKFKKHKLDVVLVYDNTAIMATDFAFDGKSNKLSSANYATSRSEAKSTKVKKELKEFMRAMSSKTGYSVRYALVTMDGDKTVDTSSAVREKYKQNYFGSIEYENNSFIRGGNQGDTKLVGDYKGTKVNDTAYNDSKYRYGFTDDTNQIINQIDSLDERTITKERISGENYASAIKNVKVLLGQGGGYQVASGGIANGDNRAREDAKKIVVFITGGDPKLGYVEQQGEYEDTYRFDNSDYYMMRNSYMPGWSYGNGYSIDYAALNQARGELHSLTKADAFYSIGVGLESNWKYLNDFAMGQYRDEDDNLRQDEAYRKAHPDRREKALIEGIRYKCFNASTEAGLKTAFEQIENRENNQVQNVVISDTLTRFVQPVDTQNPKSTVVGQLVKLKDNGVEVDHEVTDPHEKESLNFKGFDIKVNDDYIENGKKLWRISLKTIPEDFTLPAGYEIRAVAKIIPTVEAFEEIGKTFYNGEYHVAPISLDPHGTENIIKGDARTDLNAIYKEDLNREQSDKLRYASSTGQPGLPTNTEATLSYKVNGKNENKKYNRPIINPGNMVIEKAFLGFDEGEFFKESSGLTILGKEILKTISFRISRENAAGTEELLTTVSPADYLGENEDKILKIPNTNLYIKVSRVFKENRSGAPYARANGNPNISISIYNTPLNMKYRVKEVESSQGKIFSTGTKGYQFDENAVRCGAETEDLKLMDVRRNYHFFNTYKNVPVPKREKTITIRKVVEEFGGTAFTTEARNKSFEFYIGLFKYDGNKYIPLSDEDINKYIDNKWKPNNNGRSGHGEVKNIKGNKIQFDDGRGNKINATVVRMKLKHGESLTLPIDESIYYKIFESREDDYDLAKGEMSKDGISENLDIREVKYDYTDFRAGKYVYVKEAYSATDFLSRDGEITFRNPRKTLVPTGLRGDFTPYVLSLCGFTFMAGVYLSIKKKKREEI